MRTWNDYKEHVRTVDPEISKDMEEVEALSQIVKQWWNSAMRWA